MHICDTRVDWDVEIFKESSLEVIRDILAGDTWKQTDKVLPLKLDIVETWI